MTTPAGTAAAARQSASGYALRVSPRGERLTPLDGTPAYLGIEVDDALEISEQTEI
jgi:hypothetical protein